MKKKTIKQLHEIEVSHATVFHCPCFKKKPDKKKCQKCGLKINKYEK